MQELLLTFRDFWRMPFVGDGLVLVFLAWTLMLVCVVFLVAVVLGEGQDDDTNDDL